MNRKEGRIPIAKNTDSERKKTVRVLDGEGNQIGLTYPRRAAGLVKKGRAYYVNDFIIRLNMSDTTLPEGRHQSEVMKMDNQIIIDSTDNKTENQIYKLYFNPRKWSFNQTCKDNVGNRSFITGPDGVLAEAYMIGNWTNAWTEIVSETLLLPKNTDCSFTFWLNGGENDRNDEVCRLEIIFNNNFEQRLNYNLNRNYIPPVKKLNGWELYEIPFRTEDNEYTELRFVAQRAYMTILSAKDVSAYADIPDTVDPFEGERPQRHNIIFSDGFPTNSWYSTKALQKSHGQTGVTFGFQQKAASLDGQSIVLNDAETHTADFDADHSDASAIAQAKKIFYHIENGNYDSPEDFQDIVENKGEIIRGIMESALQKAQYTLQQITNEFQASASVRLNAVSASLDALSSTCDMLENLDVDSIADNIRVEQESDDHEDEDEELEDILADAADYMSDIADELRGSIEELTDSLEEIRDSLSI